MSLRLRRRSAALLLCGIGFVLIAALGLARPAGAADPPCHAAAPTSERTPAPATVPCGAVLPLLCCGDRSLPGSLATPAAGGAADLAFLPASPPSPLLPAPDAPLCRGGGSARAAPSSATLLVLRL